MKPRARPHNRALTTVLKTSYVAEAVVFQAAQLPLVAFFNRCLTIKQTIINQRRCQAN